MRALLFVLGCGGALPTDLPIDTDIDSFPDVVEGCEVGDVRPCACAGRGPGWQACAGAPDVWSTCGCDDDGPPLYVPEERPQPTTCDEGVVTCAPYRGDPPTDLAARPCCLEDGSCGSSAPFVFGDQCVPRGGPEVVPSNLCASGDSLFLMTAPCCRPDGWCGLSVDDLPDWDLGCVERSQMADWLNAGSALRDDLARAFSLPVTAVDYPSVRCEP